jgi:hypothetical protein
MTVAASKKGRQVLALVPRAIGLKYARAKEKTKTADQAQNSVAEKGDGFVICSAGIISVLTIFLIVKAVYPATANEASQPEAGKEQITVSSKEHVFHCYHILLVPTSHVVTLSIVIASVIYGI